MRLIEDSKRWYRFHSVQAALLLAILETVQALDFATIPNSITVAIALSIPVLRIIKQEAKP